MFLVDGDVDALALLREALYGHAHDVRAFHHGADAIAELALSHADVVVLELRLPDMSGFEVARAVRRDHRLPNPRLIALTGSSDEGYREEAARIGFDDFLVKPASLTAITSAIFAPRP